MLYYIILLYYFYIIYVTQCSWYSLCPSYTGVEPATYDGPGQLGSEGIPHGSVLG